MTCTHAMPERSSHVYDAARVGNTSTICSVCRYDFPLLHVSCGCISKADNSTGKERDKTGLDYFGARYYGSNMGRFLSPDWSADPTPVPYADLSNPQTLNLYQYVGNNPLATADADGGWPRVGVVPTLGSRGITPTQVCSPHEHGCHRSQLLDEYQSSLGACPLTSSDFSRPGIRISSPSRAIAGRSI